MVSALVSCASPGLNSRSLGYFRGGFIFMQFAQNLITRNISKHLSAELVQLLINRVEEWGDKGVITKNQNVGI